MADDDGDVWTEVDEEQRLQGLQDQSGCASRGIVAALGGLVLTLIAILLFAANDDKSSDTTVARTAPPSTLVTRPATTTVPVSTVAITAAAEVTAAPVTTVDAASTTLAGATTVASAATTTIAAATTVAAPPTTVPTGLPPASIPPNAQLFQGSSGDPIGCITCDGQRRFLSLQAAGVTTGDASEPAMATTWQLNGEVIEFGARVSSGNAGNYGFNLFLNGSTALGGCGIQPGQTACVGLTPVPLKAGDTVSISVTEGGTLANGAPADRGEFSVDWYFVFQPAA